MNHQGGPTPYLCFFHHHSQALVEDLLWSLRARGFAEVPTFAGVGGQPARPGRKQFTIRLKVWACRAPVKGRTRRPCTWVGYEPVKTCPKCRGRKVVAETLVEWAETVAWGRAQKDPQDTRIRRSEPARLRRAAAAAEAQLDVIPDSWAELFLKLENGGDRMVMPLSPPPMAVT